MSTLRELLLDSVSLRLMERTAAVCYC